MEMRLKEREEEIEKFLSHHFLMLIALNTVHTNLFLSMCTISRLIHVYDSYQTVVYSGGVNVHKLI